MTQATRCNARSCIPPSQYRNPVVNSFFDGLVAVEGYKHPGCRCRFRNSREPSTTLVSPTAIAANKSDAACVPLKVSKSSSAGPAIRGDSVGWLEGQRKNQTLILVEGVGPLETGVKHDISPLANFALSEFTWALWDTAPDSPLLETLIAPCSGRIRPSGDR